MNQSSQFKKKINLNKSATLIILLLSFLTTNSFSQELKQGQYQMKMTNIEISDTSKIIAKKSIIKLLKEKAERDFNTITSFNENFICQASHLEGSPISKRLYDKKSKLIYNVFEKGDSVHVSIDSSMAKGAAFDEVINVDAIESSKETKMIVGFECHKVEFEENGKTTTMFLTKQLPSLPNRTHNKFLGTPLEIKTVNPMLPIEFTIGAVRFSEEFDESIFRIDLTKMILTSPEKMKELGFK